MLCFFFRGLCGSFIFELLKYYAVRLFNLYGGPVHDKSLILKVYVKEGESIGLVVTGYKVFAVGEQRNVLRVLAAYGKAEELLKGSVGLYFVGTYAVVACIGSSDVFKIVGNINAAGGIAGGVVIVKG